MLVFLVLVWKKAYVLLTLHLPPLNWKKARQRTNQRIPIGANPWVVSLGPSMCLMMDCLSHYRTEKIPFSLSAQTTYTSVITLFQGKGELFHMKTRQPSKFLVEVSWNNSWMSSYDFKARWEFEDLGDARMILCFY